MTTHATRITSAARSVTVTSSTASVTDWALDYFGPWWNACATSSPYSGPVVSADIAPAETAGIARQLADYDHHEALYASSPMLYAADGPTVSAYQAADELAYCSEPGHLRITGHDALPVALAAARLARELLRAKLMGDGWKILHASAAVKDGQTVLTLGDKGAGKTTTALLLARSGWQLLANDRVFVRTGNDGVDVVPWPSAAAVGLGLLDALGLYDGVRERVLAGQTLHPTQAQAVTDALTEGQRLPLWNDSGKELKPQFAPSQLVTWLGLTLATEGRAARLVFPRVTPGATPATDAQGRTLTGGDFFNAATEDRYPDVFGLTPPEADTSRVQREVLTQALNGLPRHSITLGHDVKANAEFLAELADQ
ncbi:hypothetical protein ACIOUE_07145 [Streptomyces xanthochromogenes]|uniref:hypothetical protein n=1 Tax=Streptomyces xanthochromogenes TaxID=67384 RepID=UPI0038184752